MEHTSLGNHFDFYSCSPETKTIPLWGSDSDDIHDDPWIGISKFDKGFDQKHLEIEEEHQEHEEHHATKPTSKLRNQKLTRTKSFSKLPSFYKFRFRFRFRFRLRLKSRLRIMICGRKL
ncbi:hypothetical protein L6452_36869 [Arctium lappa]|uniref:Uncharacterized protein n=1 Tax=Arctium lappa TaxID=4217 RepID=A0ACB8Y1V4_ARCLA|nr:hypothetical protein L6452_36869 [Arctium lappa]